MTIAACYLSSEGVVLGADSTTTITIVGSPNAPHQYFDYAQKIFEIGQPSTLGVALWGMGSLPDLSYRTLTAQFADHLRGSSRLPDMPAVAREWAEFFWARYSVSLAPQIARSQMLNGRSHRTPDEQEELDQLTDDFSGGFCLAGNVEHARVPAAFEIAYHPLLVAAPVPEPQAIGTAKFWGSPRLFNRLLFGVDFHALSDIANSPFWTGTLQQLVDLIQPHFLRLPTLLPLREAIELVFTSIHTTSKMLKFSQFARVCGGPVEVACITADRPFRWVRHKRLGAAIGDGSDIYA